VKDLRVKAPAITDQMRLLPDRRGGTGARRRQSPSGRAAAVAMALLASAARPCAAADVALGEYLSGECTACHQLSGKAAGGIPAIVGMEQASFIEALTAYKTGKRENPVMRNIAGRLTEDDIAALAAFFAAQKQ
jgi:cytochrome c553